MARKERKLYTLTQNEVVEATRFVMHRRLFTHRRFSMIVIALVLITVAAIAMEKFTIAGTGLVALCAAPFVLGFVLYWLTPRLGRKRYSTTPSLQAPTEFDYTGNWISVASKSHTTRLAIQEWHGWGESYGLFLLFENETDYRIVPKRIMLDREVDNFRNTLIERGVPEL